MKGCSTITTSYQGKTNELQVTLLETVLNLSSIEISGPASVMENSVSNYTYRAYYNDGSSSNITSLATWSENSSYASINSSGVLSAYSVTTNTMVSVSATYTAGAVTDSDVYTITILNYPLAGPYSGGSGTLADPYQIANEDDLVNLGTNDTDYGNQFGYSHRPDGHLW